MSRCYELPRADCGRLLPNLLQDSGGSLFEAQPAAGSIMVASRNTLDRSCVFDEDLASKLIQIRELVRASTIGSQDLWVAVLVVGR